MAPTTPKASSSASSPIKTRSPSTKVSGQRKSKSPKKPTTYSPKKKSSLSVKLPNTSTSKQAQNDGGDDHDAADEDSLFFSLEDAPSNPPESVLDGMVPKPPSEEKKTRKSTKINSGEQAQTPMQRAMGKSIRKGEKVTLRRSYGKKPSKRNNKKKSVKINTSRDNDSHSGDSASELSAMMKGIVEDVKKLELEDVQNSDSSDSESASKGLSREARATRNSMTMMKSKAKSTDHKLLSGEDFTINDIISRIEDDDPDLTSLTIRQTGQNIKDVVVPAHDDDHNDDDSVQISESIILVLPAHLTNNKMVELSTSLSQNRCLLMLDLRGNSITDESCVSICNALKQNHIIQNLNLSQNRITSKGAASVVPLINKCLVTLNLSKNVLGDAGIQSLAGGIASTKTLKEIHLSDCKIRSSGASFLASAFAVNKSLQTINLQGNVCGNGSSSKRLAFALMRSQRLRHLYMGDTGIGEGIEHFARLVETTKSLKTFDLSHNFLADKAATTLGNALMINRSITHLILKRNKITSDGLQLLSACLVSNIFITSLDVGGNLIGDSGFMKLCTVLETNTSLFELDISDNRIGVEGANAISSVLKINKTLVTLNMTDNPIQYGGVMNLCQALELNETLCVCYVSVDELGKEGVDELSYEGEGSGNSPFWETRLVVV
ncbi:hypothetical protein TrLO_g12186 [Triparma laevis f. longispina]|uniref:Uncharacterized protein n=1 Tax=Triparma laevis f. longispina TaxID=1714387 RepID=A0A9W7DT39_9STRA|nr:hypothetical protein TrLO_g12186 [Triparma laevis f. longispina]